MFWSKTGGISVSAVAAQERVAAGAKLPQAASEALFVKLAAAADAVLSSRFGWPAQYPPTYWLGAQGA